MTIETLALVSDYLRADGAIVVENPATGAVLGRIASHDADAVSAIIDKADAARIAWAQHSAQARSNLLRAWHGLILAHADDLARIITLESGKPLAEAKGEVAYGASYVEWFAEEGKRAYGETIPGFSPRSRILTIRQPIGTCAAITPWNFPLAMITRKVAPALAAGCSIVVKPAEATPLTALALEKLAHEAGIPADLFRVTATKSSSAIGALFCTHPLVRKLSFTGSTRVGQILMAQAAQQVTRLSLELGGNAPFIVFDDADLDAAVEGVLASKYRNAGQTCVCANRLLVQDGVHDAFVARLVARVGQLRMGDGMADGTTLGPLIDAREAARVAALVEDARTAGCAIKIGGTGSDGAFHPATIMTGVTQDMPIAQDEIFGPVAPVIRFTDEADAIRIANDTIYGLAAYLYSRDIGRVWRVMEALEYGMVAVNEGILSTETAPFGGVKQSGMGREGSSHGLADYMEIKYALMGGMAG
ncbi:NAD-dependent succinate-semialdehyde dehydrogenase [Sphingobium sp. HBC34]|uniref:NAD-dependent succinate-semialdehyde dehydrogenase n=1 Tax=Sphingobium cyanobacteriorum TaxID=3063954 RepID=A0ABT8ZLV9_9SPHN|nr:NAD-dependent succinate-semialdehyde dehydrogenase [Sphingobium sp. HBC34]MDO7835532.1 NAD-dependent succinate-semialdehyde dehydrogenase [Sphingobium sp. HBC34]